MPLTGHSRSSFAQRLGGNINIDGIGCRVGELCLDDLAFPRDGGRLGTIVALWLFIVPPSTHCIIGEGGRVCCCCFCSRGALNALAVRPYLGSALFTGQRQALVALAPRPLYCLEGRCRRLERPLLVLQGQLGAGREQRLHTRCQLIPGRLLRGPSRIPVVGSMDIACPACPPLLLPRLPSWGALRAIRLYSRRGRSCRDVFLRRLCR